MRQNLAHVLAKILRAGQQRETPTLESARHWHTVIMRGLKVPDARFVGAFRGEPGLGSVEVWVGSNYGVEPAYVAGELARFESRLQALTRELDERLPPDSDPDADQLAAIVDFCAWVHAEWVRIHPFVNGSGRTARLWANSLAMRYGLPPFMRLRPRPNAGYADAGALAIQGEWEPTAIVFRRLLRDSLNEL